MRRALVVSCLTWTIVAAHPLAARADRTAIQIVVADRSAASQRLAEALRLKFSRAAIVTGSSNSAQWRRAWVHIAIGPQALRELLDSGCEGVIIALYTSSPAYQSLVSGRRMSAVALTAIYAEPGPVEQLQLITRLYRRPVTVAVLLSSSTTFLQPILQRAAAQQGIPLSIEIIDGAASLNRALNRISGAAALLAVPDAGLYAVENVRQVLMTTYRHGQAVVGFSRAWVQAGALATTVSNPDDMAAQLAEMIESYFASGKLPAPQFPKYFRVSVNEQVAKSLNLVVDADTVQWTRLPPEGLP